MPFLNDITFYLQDKPLFLHLAFWGSGLLLLAILGVMAYLFVFRINFLIARFRRRRVEQEWLDVFRLLKKGEEPAQLPRLARGEKVFFLELWLEHRKLADDHYGRYLDALARRVALQNTIVSILRPGKLEILPSKIWLQGIAIAAVEYIDTEQTREMLLEMTESDNTYVVVNACASLAKLKVPGYEREIIQTMFRFPADAPEIFARVSQAGGSDVLHIMLPFLDRLPRHTVMNFISLAESSDDESLIEVLLYRLKRTTQEEEIAAILRCIGRFDQDGLREAVLPFLEHSSTYIRIQAAKAIGRLGTTRDIRLLVPLLSDPDWWMRYRAARAIVKLSNQNWDALAKLQSELHDQYAKDIILHAYEEMDWCWT